MAKPRLAPIYERLAGAPQYHPMNAETFADWSLEAGDIVTVKREGTGYSSPVHTVRMKWNGVPTTQIESVGEKKRESIAKMSAQKYARGGGGGGGVRNSHYQHIFVQDAYGRMQSGLELTGSTAHLYARDLYAQMESGLALTTSSAALYVDDRYNQMSSGLALTSSSAALYVDDRYNQMSSGLALTSSSAALYVDDKYNQMKSGLALTSSTAALYVDDSYNRMKSGLDLTSSSAKLYVDDRYNQMKSGLSLSTSSAVMYAKSKDAAAEIVARINEDNEGEIKLDADHVYIGKDKSTTVIAGKTTLSEVEAEKLNTTYLNSLIGKIPILSVSSLYVSGTINSNGYIYASNFVIGSNSSGGGGNKYLNNAVIGVDVTDNTLTLTQANGTETSFSKAISSATWTWAGGAPKVTLSPQDQTFYGKAINGITFTGKKTWAKDNKSFTQDFYCYDEASNNVYTENLSIDTKDSYNAGYNNGSPNGTVTIGSKITGTNYNISIARSDGTSVAGTKDFDSIYKAAREGYSPGTYTQTTVTLQGQRVTGTAYHTVDTGGTVFYTAGTAVTAVGQSVTPTKKTGNYRGTEVSMGSDTIYRKIRDKYSEIGYCYYCASDKGASKMYKGGSSFTYYDVGSEEVLYKAGSSVTPISGGTRMASVVAYQAGSTDTTHYYTKS